MFLRVLFAVAYAQATVKIKEILYKKWNYWGLRTLDQDQFKLFWVKWIEKTYLHVLKFWSVFIAWYSLHKMKGVTVVTQQSIKPWGKNLCITRPLNWGKMNGSNSVNVFFDFFFSVNLTLRPKKFSFVCVCVYFFPAVSLVSSPKKVRCFFWHC